MVGGRSGPRARSDRPDQTRHRLDRTHRATETASDQDRARIPAFRFAFPAGTGHPCHGSDGRSAPRRGCAGVDSPANRAPPARSRGRIPGPRPGTVARPRRPAWRPGRKTRRAARLDARARPAGRKTNIAAKPGDRHRRPTRRLGATALSRSPALGPRRKHARPVRRARHPAKDRHGGHAAAQHRGPTRCRARPPGRRPDTAARLKNPASRPARGRARRPRRKVRYGGPGRPPHVVAARVGPALAAPPRRRAVALLRRCARGEARREGEEGP
jgi:hypothetical protein